MFPGRVGESGNDQTVPLSPTLPGNMAEWEKAEMTRQFRGAQYNIVIHNPNHLEQGILDIRVDGERIDGNVIQDFRDHKVHEVEVVIREA